MGLTPGILVIKIPLYWDKIVCLSSVYPSLRRTPLDTTSLITMQTNANLLSNSAPAKFVDLDES